MHKFKKVIRFDNQTQTQFTEVLTSRVDQYFASTKQGVKANSEAWLHLTLTFTLLTSFWFALSFYSHGLIKSILLIVGLVLAKIALAFVVAHDAAHGGIAKKSKINNFIFQLSYTLLGPNYYLWKTRHNIAHHLYVNIPGCDIDIEGTKILRLAPHIPWLPVHRFQHLYATLCYMIFTIHWIFIKDFVVFKMSSFGNMKDIKHSPWRLVEMIALKLVYVTYMLVIPAIFLPYSFSTILIAFICFHFLLSYLVMICFVGAHLSTVTQFVEVGDDGKIPHNFYVHALLTSVDFHVGNPLMDFLCGGLNSHVAHHMFPNINSVHLPAVTKIIKKTAREFGLPYYQKDLVDLVRSHYRFLMKMGENPKSSEEKTQTFTYVLKDTF
jgi:linoleoyl-CoA desaturase